MTTQFKVCSCNNTIPLDQTSGRKLGETLGTGPLPVHSQLCRREVGSFLTAAEGLDQTVVACTQESALFSELAQQKSMVAPLRFVNIRETAGWSNQAGQALPKMAALLAEAALPDPDPVPIVNYESHGHVLIIGDAQHALPWAKRLAGQLEVSVLLTGGEGQNVLGERVFPVFSTGRQHLRIEGWLGAFQVSWAQANPIDLEACTRCNACVQACPENAIDLSYQINLDKCSGHRDCVKACAAIGAIDFERIATERSGEFDLVFDLSEAPLIALHQPPQGYFAPGTGLSSQLDASLQLTQMVGQFEKPKFFQYRESICAHGRNGKIGCNACVEVCSAGAVHHEGNHIKVIPNLCVGCGACTTVCPSGALSYAYPPAPHTGRRIKTLLSTYFKAGGQKPALLLHSKESGAQLIRQLGRLASAGGNAHGVPARIIPLELHHTASVGLDLLLAAIAYGAANVAILLTDEEAPQYRDALAAQILLGQTILSAMGYDGEHLKLLEAVSPVELQSQLALLQPAQSPQQPALFGVAAEKRATLEFSIDHLLKHAPLKPEQIPLPGGAPFGAVNVNKEACTLCMSCVGACPEAALADNPAAPQLRFLEQNCVQCGLCVKTCPEGAITLTPRLLLSGTAKQNVVLHEEPPYHCIRCAKPFATRSMIENMVGKLSLHSAFAGNTDRIRMCADCRVVDMMGNQRETSVTDLTR